jgi:ABC-2 type transport system permease protein
VLTATGVIVHSLAFWAGPMDTLARQYWEFTVMFSCYPRSIFGGLLRVALFSVIPAGFVAYLPVELLRNFAWPGLALAFGGAVVYGGLALWVFHAGLRRYESGNRFRVRA